MTEHLVKGFVGVLVGWALGLAFFLALAILRALLWGFPPDE